MSLIDVEKVLHPISDAVPTGPNLELDRAFAELERTARGKPEQQIGEAVSPGEPPDWSAVQDQAVALLSKTKDLRVASHLLRALLNRHGFAGLNEGLAIVRGMLERFWSPLHPQLDPEDPSDPIRVNALAGLSDLETIAALRSAPLVRSRAFGPITFRDVAVANGDLPPAPNTQKLEMAAVEASFQDCPIADLEATAQAIRGAFEQMRGLERVFAENSGGPGPDVTSLVKIIRQSEQLVLPRLEKRKAAEMPQGGAGDDGVAQADGQTTASRSGEIHSREDVVRALERICGYYERYEPSSPLPLLLQRCKRLATMSFIDIVRDMVPESMAQVEVIAGKLEQS
jgi:type VI secretion system protein ImpA